MIKSVFNKRAIKKAAPVLLGALIIILPFQNCGKGFQAQQKLELGSVTNSSGVIVPAEPAILAQELFKINPLRSSTSQISTRPDELLTYEIELLKLPSVIIDASIELLGASATTTLAASRPADPSCMIDIADPKTWAGKVRFQPGTTKCTVTIASTMTQELLTDFSFDLQITIKTNDGKSFVKTTPGKLLAVKTNVLVASAIFEMDHLACKKNSDMSIGCSGQLTARSDSQTVIFAAGFPEFKIISEFKNAVQIAENGHAACALIADGSVRCIGDSTEFPAYAKPGVSGIKVLDTLFGFNCPLNLNGRLGTDGICPLPTYFSGGQNFTYPVDKTFKTVASGGSFGCGVSVDGKVFCWGTNSYGQLGSGDISTNRFFPAQEVPGLTNYNVTKLFIGGSTICALTSGKEVFCWGHNNLSQTFALAEPPRKLNLSRVNDVKANDQNICVIQDGDQWSCVSEGYMTTTSGTLAGIKNVSLIFFLPLFQVQDGSWKCPTAGRYYNSGTGLDCWPK